jgi:hypothetical protein
MGVRWTLISVSDGKGNRRNDADIRPVIRGARERPQQVMDCEAA